MTDPNEIEALARAMCVELGEDPDEEHDPDQIPGHKDYQPRWKYHVYFARQYLAARRAEAKAEPVAGMTDDEIVMEALKASSYEGLTGGTAIRDMIREAIRLARANTRPLLTAEQVEAIVTASFGDWIESADVGDAVRCALRLAGVSE